MQSNGAPSPAARDALVLAAARIAEDLISRCSPSQEAVFAFAAGVVGAGQRSDRRAVRLAFELAAGLLDNVPGGRAWSETRGRLWTTKLFAWLLLQAHREAEQSDDVGDPREARGRTPELARRNDRVAP
jgi:hypothetical protein